MRGVTIRFFKVNIGLSEFQLTRLMRGVTEGLYPDIAKHIISTHTPHARRDFNFRASAICTFQFQLTRLMRGVTRQRPALSKIG